MKSVQRGADAMTVVIAASSSSFHFGSPSSSMLRRCRFCLERAAHFDGTKHAVDYNKVSLTLWSLGAWSGAAGISSHRCEYFKSLEYTVLVYSKCTISFEYHLQYLEAIHNTVGILIFLQRECKMQYNLGITSSHSAQCDDADEVHADDAW